MVFFSMSLEVIGALQRRFPEGKSMWNMCHMCHQPQLWVVVTWNKWCETHWCVGAHESPWGDLQIWSAKPKPPCLLGGFQSSLGCIIWINLGWVIILH
jgi:hypothetical protein